MNDALSQFRAQPSLFIAFIAASLSGLTILLHALGWISLIYSATMLAPLAAMTFVSLVVRAGRGREDVLLNRIIGGLIAGAFGLLAYDLVRLVVMTMGVPFNPFRPIEIYGLLILDRTQDSDLTRAVGWAFHIWNGLSFAMMYALTFGRGRLLFALGWGMALEITMLVTYPSIFKLLLDWAFVSVSFIGHTAYGLALGVAARRFVKW